MDHLSCESVSMLSCERTYACLPDSNYQQEKKQNANAKSLDAGERLQDDPSPWFAQNLTRPFNCTP